MTRTDKITRRKLSMLELASELDKACRIMGYSRQQFYEIRRNFQTYGAEGLIDRLLGARGPHPNRVSEEVEQAILQHALDHPGHGSLRVSQELMLQGVQVSSGGVRGVWSRHKLLTKHDRLLRLEQHVAKHRITLSNDQVEGRRQSVSADGGGLLLPLCLGPTLHQQTAGDSSACDEPRCAANLRGAQRPDRHPYELFLQLEEIEHRTTKVRRPQSNGFVERLHRTLLDEHFRIMGRKKFYDSVEEMQKDLDAYLRTYNTTHPHHGRNMNGRPPEAVFKSGLPKPKKSKEETNRKAAETILHPGRQLSADYRICTHKSTGKPNIKPAYRIAQKR
jgi:hypothetical protein